MKWKKGAIERNVKAGLITKPVGYGGKGCLFCNRPEKSYKPERGVDFVCSDCVIILADASQDSLKLAYKKAIEVVSLKQVRALDKFIMPEEMKDGQTKPKPKLDRRRSNRKRNIKPSGDKKKRFGKA